MAQPNHPYQSCRDRGCELPFCRIWREARDEGYAEGFEDGYGDGYRAGTAAGK